MATVSKTKKDKITPMMAQYLALKETVPDCLLFYRMGDFFELFFEDAKTAAATLDIALTARGEHAGQPIPMCGVPAHSHEAYLARLIKAGHRVALADQTETPDQAKKRAGSKALVGRAVVRVVTAGTLTEETLLDARAANWLVAIAEVDGRAGLAAADISTGRFELSSAAVDALDAELARLDPAETIASEGLAGAPEGTQFCPKADFNSLAGERQLKSLFAVATLDGFGSFNRAEMAAAGGLLAYLETAGQGAMPLLQPPHHHSADTVMLIDAATRESLELTQAIGGGRGGSLLACIDRTVTGAGARLLATDIGAPLAEREPIEQRLDLVDHFAGDAGLREAVRAALKALPDVGRALGRLAANRGGPRDLGQLRDGLGAARALHDRLASTERPPQLLERLLPALTGHGALTDHLSRALVPAPPADAAHGGFIAEGFDAALDDLRAASGEGRKAIAALEAGYREQTGIARLKIKHNNVLGYHVEVPAKFGDGLMAEDSGFTHRQTLAGVVRFNAPDLHEQALRVTQAGAHALAAEAAHLEDLIATTLRDQSAISRTADAIARLDVSAALAELAAVGGWTRARLVDEPSLIIEGCRQ
jgi:DNA mismatch repair protein MutS